MGYGKDSSVVLIKLVMIGFGLIQGMDWLSNYGAMLNCKERLVTLGFESGKPCDSWHCAWIMYAYDICIES